MCARRCLIAIVLVLILVLVYHLFSRHSIVRRLAKCGWTVYYLDGCGYCELQKKQLPGFDNYVEYASGGVVKAAYTATPPVAFASISAFPYWYNPVTKQSKVGYLNARELRALSCS